MCIFRGFSHVSRYLEHLGTWNLKPCEGLQFWPHIFLHRPAALPCPRGQLLSSHPMGHVTCCCRWLKRQQWNDRKKSTWNCGWKLSYFLKGKTNILPTSNHKPLPTGWRVPFLLRHGRFIQWNINLNGSQWEAWCSADWRAANVLGANCALLASPTFSKQQNPWPMKRHICTNSASQCLSYMFQLVSLKT